MEDVEDEKSFNDANAAPLADHHGTESMATPDIYYTLDPARKLLSGNLFEMLQAMSALPGKDWYFGGSKGFEGKKGPFGKTPEKLVQDLRESRIDPMAPVMVSPSPWQRNTALINELPGKTRVA